MASGVDTHTHIHTHILWRNESDFKKPGARAWFNNKVISIYMIVNAWSYHSHLHFIALQEFSVMNVPILASKHLRSRN